GTMDARFFSRLGASRLDRTVCAAPTGVVARAFTGKMPGVAFPDYVHAKLIVLWGANPFHSNIHLVPFLKQARERGARVVLIDPRRTGSASYIDQWLPIFPGTDVALALALIHELAQNDNLDAAFIREHTSGSEAVLEAAQAWTLERAAEVTRIPARQIAQLAADYAAAEPAVIRVGWGPERNRNGGSAIAAILALVAVTGKFGRRGGGYTLSNSGTFRVNDAKLAALPEPKARRINMNHLGRALAGELDGPPIQALFVYDCNPVASVPDQNAIVRGLLREDLFTVVFDAVRTDTAEYADILLPAVTFLEQRELLNSYGAYALQYIEPVIEPLGESRANEAVFSDLARAMGFSEPEFQEDFESLLRRALAGIEGPVADRLNVERLRRERILPFDFPGPAPIQFVTAFPQTEDRKMRLAPPELGPRLYAYREPEGDAKHPLLLISPASDKTISTVLGELNGAEPRLLLHPGDAAERGLSDGQPVRVFNALGEVHCRLELSGRICRGVASLPKGLWRRSFPNRSSSTALVPDQVSEIGAGACFNDTRAEVAALD
ncbi:MAG TPA: molybdopterin-dependent oxidoreductase, partial [Acidobacteriota bacterium]